MIKEKWLYTGKTDKQKVDRGTKIQKLLVNFKLSVTAFDPGVKCLVLGDTSFQPRYVDFDKSTWEWLEPLLRELLMFRNGGKKQIDSVVKRIHKSCNILDKEVQNEIASKKL